MRKIPKKNITFGLIGLFAVIIGFICKTVYRDYVKSNGINDYGIAGFLPSYFYVLGFALLLLIRPFNSPKLIISIVTAASILFELNRYSSRGVFDFKDSLASIAGGITAIMVSKLFGSSKKSE